MLELKGESLALQIPEGQKDKLIQAFYAWCIDNKIDAVIIKKD